MNQIVALLIALTLAVCGAKNVHAAQLGKGSSLGISKTGGNTAKATVKESGGQFGELLGKPSVLSGGRADFQQLLDLPVKLPDFPADKATAKAFLSPKNIAKALRGGVQGYLAGEAMKALADAACVRLMGGTMQMTDSGAWEECVPGAGSTPSLGYKLGLRGTPAGTYDTVQAACDAYLAFLKTSQPGQPFRPDACTAPTATADGVSKVARLYPDGSVFDYMTNAIYRNETPECPAGKHIWADGTCHDDPQVSDASYRPISTSDAEQKLEDAIKNPSNSSKVWDSLKDYTDKGGTIEIDNPTITGPAQSPTSTTSSTTTTQTPSGPQTLTTITNTTITYNYAGDTVTYNQVTNSVTRNQNGEEVSSTTTSTPPAPTTGGSSESSDDPPVDTALPPVPDLYVRKYPNGMEGIYDMYGDQLKNSQFMQLVNKLMPSISDGGSCPNWPLDLTFASWADYGVHDVAPPCWIWEVAGAILLVSALLLARALVFGG